MARARLSTSHLSCSGRDLGPVTFWQEAIEDSTGSPSGRDGITSAEGSNVELRPAVRGRWILSGVRRRRQETKKDREVTARRTNRRPFISVARQGAGGRPEKNWNIYIYIYIF